MKTWETSDLYLAAFLRVLGFDLAETRREGGGWRVVFVFEDDEDLRAAVQTWLTTKGVVVAHHYRDAIRDLKAAVHR